MDRDRDPGRWRAGWALAVLAAACAVYAPTVAWLWTQWTASVWDHAHGLLIPVLSAYFAWAELRRLPGLPRQASAWGFVFLVPAVILVALDASLRTGFTSAVSLVLALPGLSLLLLGPHRTRAIAFPLAFLAFMLPVPDEGMSRLHLVLRRVSAAATATIVPWLGIPVLAEDTTLHLSRATLEVADACSGFSTLYASLAVAALAAYFCRTWARRWLVLVLAAPIAIAVNVVRVVALVLLVDRWGVDVLGTSLHETTGLISFALALPLILWLGDDRRSVRAAP